LRPNEDGLRNLLGRHDVTLYDVSYGLLEGGEVFEYRAGLQTSQRAGLAKLAATLRATEGLREFQLLRISK
jgi:hypothetical protein